jgi:hypothetical protein
VAAASDADLAVVETRLQAILDPYRDRLEPFEIYGMPMLRRPGARAHEWFAGVNRGNGVVRFSLLPMHRHPELLDDLSAELRKRKRGTSLFAFSSIDDAQISELEGLVARSFEVDQRDGRAAGPG